MKKTTLYSLILCVWLVSSLAYAQQKKQVTLEDVWAKGTFRTKSVYGVNWSKDGQYYTSQVENKIVKYEITTGKEVATLYDGSQEFDNYAFSANEDKILLEATREQIYRRSTRGDFYVYEIASKKLTQVNQGGKFISYCTFSPDGSKVAYVRDNNLYFKDLATQAETEITNTGKFNFIINGSTDWVYEEEFGFAQAFFWSPDSKKLAYYIFDESNVKEYNMQMWNGQKTGYPTDYRFKYPKVGEDNAIVEIAIYHLDTKKVVKADIGTEKDQYIPRVKWTNEGNTLSIRRLNRWQNNLDLLHADAQTGATKVVLNEKSETYVDIEYNDHLTYLQDGKHFIFASERSGFKHLYLYDMAGKLIRPITAGEWEVTDFHGIDEKKKLVYFSSAEVSPLERYAYVIGLDGKNKKQLTTNKGTNEPNFSADFKYFLNYHASASSPNTVTLHESTGKLLKTLEDNAKAREVLASYAISYPEFMSFKTEDGTSINGYMIKPQNFDASKKYPVLMYVYGGPGHQAAKNEWQGANFFWYQTLAQKGYIIVCFDNRGTGGRGTKFKHSTYLQLGKYEIQDQISGAKYLGTLPFVDKERIGIWGWSFGGYMASLGITVGADVFKTAIAVAPVTTWRFYDSIYTERFLRRPQDNASGYDDNSPINHVSKMKGNYFLIHGTGDDNVHFQNAVEMQDALIKANKQFTSFYYPNRNHGIYGGVTRLHLFKMMTDYIEKNL